MFKWIMARKVENLRAKRKKIYEIFHVGRRVKILEGSKMAASWARGKAGTVVQAGALDCCLVVEPDGVPEMLPGYDGHHPMVQYILADSAFDELEPLPEVDYVET